MNSRRSFLAASLGSGLGCFAAQPFQSLNELIQSSNENRAQQAKAMLVSTTGPHAIRCGLNAMRDGGSAADGVLTTALTQIALCAGCWVSYAGRMTAMYFDADSERVHALNACYDAPRNEIAPETIPPPATRSGRNVLVPGFMAGVEALHRKFGKSSFASLFDPAIRLADEGMKLTPQMAALIKRKSKVLTHYQAARDVFTNQDGDLYAQGSHFRQRQLAQTLKQVAREGARYMYQGDWAHRFVKAVQAEGGKLSLSDLEQYKPTWSDPLATELSHGISVCGLPEPNRGGPLALAALNLADHAGIKELGHFTQSVEALRRVLQIEMASRVISLSRGRDALARQLDLNKLSLNDFADRGLGRRLWTLIQSDKWEPMLDRLRRKPVKSSEHSDAIVAVDPMGNVAAVLHTINTAGWGQTGLFVDGISIPDSGATQQTAIAEAGPGGRISDHGPPLIAVRDGKPILAGSATGSGNVNASWQNFVDVLIYEMTPQQAADSANFYSHTFEKASLDTAFFENAVAHGVPVKQKPRFQGNEMGYWAGIGVDSKSRQLQSGKIGLLDGITLEF